MTKNNLAVFRKMRGLTQAELGEALGFSDTTITRAEAGDKTAKLHTYVLAAEYLGITLADIFTEDREPVDRELAKIINGLEGEQKQQALEILRLATNLQPQVPQSANRSDRQKET